MAPPPPSELAAAAAAAQPAVAALSLDERLARTARARVALAAAGPAVVDEGPLYQDPHVVVGGIGDSGTAGARPKLEQLVFARRVHRAPA